MGWCVCRFSIRKTKYTIPAHFYVVQPTRDSCNKADQVDKSPYAYVWNSPILLTDPDGNCPWCLGALIGAATDYGLQVIENLAEGKSFGDAFTDVDGTSIATSAILGATGAGLLNKAGKALKTGKKISKAAQLSKNAKQGAKFEKHRHLKSFQKSTLRLLSK